MMMMMRRKDRSLLAVCVALVAALGGSLSVPPHEEVARMARFVVNKCDWASMATISTHDPVRGQPFSNAFSISDGPAGNGTGTPYLYLTHLEISVQDLQVNPQSSLSVSLAQTSYCKNHGFDPQSPLCAHIILSGSMVEVNGSEASVAKAALFSRHPEMIDWPTDHNWFFAKMNITQVWVLDYFGGVKTVTPEEYYRATPYRKHSGSDTL
ncbi:protein CREG1 [Sinocyclocheilus rhinocerous]|uniref:Protein CREG1-like n=1 Tax=Sinocyclocheilus rhinocerous TaxID=307959 RepID=A0A673LSN9_9TELE|nr:PREDICTED: protein CREG1-like [Sinocyclocheilus rhinocerous]